ncbi:MAG: imidazole glycerol phosphate synthase subunit HisH [Dokdonella sp.]
MNVRAVIVAAGGANFGSLREACRRIDIDADVSDDPARIRNATHVILPGVGAAAQAMRGLRERGLDRVLERLEQPLLGVCLGMQLLYETSEEAPGTSSRHAHHPHANPPGPQAQPSGVHRRADPWSASAPLHPLEGEGFKAKASAAIETTQCLGLLAGTVRRLPPAPSWPHMGWNQIAFDVPAHPLLAGLDANDWFYFVHGYAAANTAQTIARCEHGAPFAAVVADRNICGAQFHPEKSATAGRRLLTNFFALT